MYTKTITFKCIYI